MANYYVQNVQTGLLELIPNAKKFLSEAIDNKLPLKDEALAMTIHGQENVWKSDIKDKFY